MGLRGPAPKPEHARLRRNAGYEPRTKVEPGQRTEAPYEPDEDWHPVAVEFWESFQDSAHTQLFQPTDWMKLYTMCEQLSRELKPQFIGWSESWNAETGQMERKPMRAKIPMKGSTLSALGQWMTTLGVTYADRLRMQIELKNAGDAQSGPPDPNGEAGNVIDFGARRTS